MTAKDDPSVVQVLNGGGASAVVLVCEHASSFIPDDLNHLGLAEADRLSHAAWDPGALAVAEILAQRLDAKLVASRISRLVYDCNRPPSAPDAMPERSEVIVVPGNVALDSAARDQRIARYYQPFLAAVRDTMQATQQPILVTVHSFTPIYHGAHRPVEIGILHDSDTRLADAMLKAANGSPLDVRRNAPYGPEDGVTHTLKEHAIAQGFANVMLEIRNDLIATAPQQADIAAIIGDWLEAAVLELDQKGQTTCAG